MDIPNAYICSNINRVIRAGGVIFNGIDRNIGQIVAPVFPVQSTISREKDLLTIHKATKTYPCMSECVSYGKVISK